MDDKDVLNFLIFKDVNDSGRTVVHKETCPHLGTTSVENCVDTIQCGLRHQAESMRVGIVDKLRKGFEEVERKASNGRPYSLYFSERIYYIHQARTRQIWGIIKRCKKHGKI